jgi:hypothetical protein
VPAKTFKSLSWLEGWGARAIVAAERGAMDHLRAAIQHLSEPEEDVVYTAAGWRETPSGWHYLSGAGAVGDPGIRVDLGPELVRFRVPVTPDEPREAMAQSLALLDVAPLAVTAPLWAGAFRAVLSDALPVDFTLWCEGPTGVQKSSLAAVFLAHFGDFPDKNALHFGWDSSANFIEMVLYLMGSHLVPCDDFVAGPEHKDLQAKATRVIRSQGNLSGRGRLGADLALRPTYPPRAFPLVTAEGPPVGQSILARTFRVRMEPGVVDLKRLSALQRRDRLLRLPHAIAGFSEWLAPRMKDGLSTELRDAFEEERGRAHAAGAAHLRLPEAIAHLILGMRWGLTYAEATGALTTEEHARTLDLARQAITGLGASQGHEVANRDPGRMFLEMLQGLLTEGRHVVLPRLGPLADRPEPKGPIRPVLGWVDEAALYLVPRMAFGAVTQAARERGIPFGSEESTVIHDLARLKVAEDTPGTTFTVVARINGEPRRVIKLWLDQAKRYLGTELWAPERTSDLTSGAARADEEGSAPF